MRPKRRAVRNPELYDQVLERLVQMRDRYNKTQAQVATGIGISRSQYTLIEKGQSTLSIDQLFSLAQFYKVEPGELFKP